MKRNGQITAALMMATMAAVGCSNGDDKPQAKESKPQVSTTAQMTPVSLNTDSTALKVGDSKSKPPAEPAGPVSYADGEKAYQMGNYTGAARIFEVYSEEHPKNAWGHYMLGLSAWKSGNPVRAEMAFNEALRLDPKHVKSLVNLSRVLVEDKRQDEALELLTRASEIDPKLADTHRMLGRTYAAQGKVDDAITSYRTAITLDEKDAWSMNNLGLLFIGQQRYDDALPFLARAVELRKEPIFYNNLGMALEHTKYFGAAASAYKGALEADPDFENAQRNLKRVEGVKTQGEEPIDLEAIAKHVVE
jgi:tetratricopeptide (TPR) repeat protein